jgi:hypothetical protein
MTDGDKIAAATLAVVSNTGEKSPEAYFERRRELMQKWLIFFNGMLKTPGG